MTLCCNISFACIVFRNCPRALSCSSTYRSSQKQHDVDSSDNADQPDEPIKYSSTEARHYRSFDTFLTERSAPWYQPYVVIASLSVFAVYFFILREENDWDEDIGLSIFEKVPGLHAADLHNRIQEAKRKGLDTSDLQRELDQLYRERK